MFHTRYKADLHSLLSVACSALIVVLACDANALAQPAEREGESQNNHVGTISELRDKQRAWLVVFKSRVVDAGDADKAIIEDVLKAEAQPRGRYRYVYNELANKLNKYIRRYGSLTSARNLADAEYVIFFNVVEFRRILNAVYPWGELFVIVKGSPQESKPPRIVWRARKMMVGTDAINDLVKALKALRGES
ncbi:MAG TPA: hypothetical protein VNO50_18110 [Pyrinomonadaceae bacterium]|nr:hypothetical protein [Pyrinomonadaceae bacterium]